MQQIARAIPTFICCNSPPKRRRRITVCLQTEQVNSEARAYNVYVHGCRVKTENRILHAHIRQVYMCEPRMKTKGTQESGAKIRNDSATLSTRDTQSEI